MKNKNKIHLFAVSLLFLSVFFVGIDKVNNIAKASCASCDELCTGSDGENMCESAEMSACVASYCGSTPTDTGGGGYDFCDNNYTDPTCCKTNGGYWYGNTCNTEPQKSDCTDYPNTYAVNGLCQCKEGFTRASDGSCFIDGAVGPGASCGNDFRTQECCVANQGYWYNNECNTSPSTSGKKGDSCLPASSWYSFDSSCANGFTCGSGGTCEVSTVGRVFGVGQGTSGGGASSAPRPVATTTAPTNVGGRQIPTGTQINTDGSATNPQTGEQVAPPGSFPIPSTGIGNGFEMCGNGILAAECRDPNGNITRGIPLIAAPRTGNGVDSTGLGNVAGASGVVAPKCGANFQDIGGVCFPMNTGLSSTPIYVIVSNIFSWLMGLFTTLAILAFVVSGIQYFMASGDESMAEKAKENATHAIIGIIVGLSGFIIIKAIAAALTGQSMFF